MTVHVLHNPKAPRRAARASNFVTASLRSQGQRVVPIAQRTAEGTSTALEDAVDRGEIERLVIAGGDGLVHLAIQHLAQTTIPVTIVPVGTGNDFANAIADHLGSTRHRSISADLIRVTRNDGSMKWAASVAIAGFPATINSRANQMNRVWGPNVYALAAARELPTFERQRISLRIDSTEISTDTAMLAIGNTKYFGGGMLPCPNALPNDHLLHLTSIEGVDRRGLLPHLLGREGGTDERDEVRKLTGTSIDIESQRCDFWADGEPLGASPLRFEVVPEALQIEHVVSGKH